MMRIAWQALVDLTAHFTVKLIWRTAHFMLLKYKHGPSWGIHMLTKVRDVAP
jgi:hypothetical protein